MNCSTVFTICTIFLVFSIHFETSVEGIRLQSAEMMNQNLNMAMKDDISYTVPSRISPAEMYFGMEATVESINDSGPSHRGRGHDSPPANGIV
ncbi:hypothetical protein ISN45_At02g000680 [Arabidopsis thaliana x Arabidopsis arenosa]|nr:hypothetical protein ISN45_At02g000680 [Arabidopsis thaliana x Arabidopsis arenosa]KAG7640193.1 hypothetical protein ISN44_As02g000650 [Arabidopsis suecica]